MTTSKEKEIVLVLNNIRSGYNVGSIFRTADAAGVKKIYLCGITPAPPHHKITKVALGAEKYIPFEKKWRCWQVLDELSRQKYFIIALEQSSKSIPYYKLNIKFPLALILGNEIKGLSPKILARCNKIIYIPMYGKKESLNVSVACGIALFGIKNQASCGQK